MKKNNGRTWLTVIVVLILIAAAFVWYLDRNASKSVEQLDKTKIDISSVADGEYEGYSEAGPVKVEVLVLVKDKKIQRIDLLRHDNGLGGKAEGIIDEILAKNTIEIDAVAGATVSSEVIKDAIRQALKQGV